MMITDFEARLLSLMGALALVLVFCLVSLWFDRRRRPSMFNSPSFRSAHVQPTQKAAPIVATIIEHKTDGRDNSEAHRRQARHQRLLTLTTDETNHGMY